MSNRRAIAAGLILAVQCHVPGKKFGMYLDLLAHFSDRQEAEEWEKKLADIATAQWEKRKTSRRELLSLSGSTIRSRFKLDRMEVQTFSPKQKGPQIFYALELSGAFTTFNSEHSEVDVVRGTTPEEFIEDLPAYFKDAAQSCIDDI